ncbi:hypothetical protein U9M48_022173 [Paspalum notatum var. saurae]|uniref:Transposase MuDR plant domain-containing protein n=1 Tax=Paspalum notatum var. saurae TaxID=547442 RepID=A0AAQ3TMD4_PASNO
MSVHQEKMKKLFKAFKKKLKTGEGGSLDYIVLEKSNRKATEFLEIGGGDVTRYEESDENESVEMVGSECELRKKSDCYRKFDANYPASTFEIRIKFTGKKEFKEAILRYCFRERKVIKYLKDDDSRRIAAKLEKFILSNPRWNFVRMKNIVLEGMFVDVKLSKLMRAKAIVMKKAIMQIKIHMRSSMITS